jgi:uncharacterized membrane protein YuzA (DUF378 family)
MKNIGLIAHVLMVIGAINWGLVGLLGINIVSMLLGSIPILETIVYGLVGASGVYAAFMMLTGKACTK